MALFIRIGKWIIYIVGVFILLNIALFMFGLDIFGLLSEDEQNSGNTVAVEEDYCGNTAGIELRGELVTYLSQEYYDEAEDIIYDQTASEDIVAMIMDAELNDNIEAIIIEIDSIGGGIVAAEEIANELILTEKPTIALIRGYGLSAAYLAATGADYIIASENSDVGGIGVTMSYLDYSKQNEAEGITYQEISSGKFKDTGDPDKPLSAEEKEYLERDTQIMHDNFVKMVADNRGMEIEAVNKLADGSSMLGKMALENGLIDATGGILDALIFLDDEYKMDSEVCWY